MCIRDSYQSVWVSPEQKKVLHIVPSYWDFIPGQEIDVLIYSNARDVELLSLIHI